MSRPVTPNDYIEYDNYYEIILRNKFKEEVGRTKVSKDKFDLIHKFRWFLNAYGYANAQYKNVAIMLNRLVVLGSKKTNRSMVVDHINRDKLDNRNENLRLVTTAQNCCNQGKRDSNCNFLKMKFYNDKDIEDDNNIIQAIRSKTVKLKTIKPKVIKPKVIKLKSHEIKKKNETIEKVIDEIIMKKYTIKAFELAENFNVTKQTIMNLFRKGDIPGVKIGGAIRFSEEDVQAWVDKQSNNCGHEKRA